MCSRSNCPPPVTVLEPHPIEDASDPLLASATTRVLEKSISEQAEADPSPASSAFPGQALPADATFECAAYLVLDYLHDRILLAFWAVTRVENGRQTCLYLDAATGYELRQGQRRPWRDSFFVQTAADIAPRAPSSSISYSNLRCRSREVPRCGKSPARRAT